MDKDRLIDIGEEILEHGRERLVDDDEMDETEKFLVEKLFDIYEEEFKDARKT